jgi:hypothetical protein
LGAAAVFSRSIRAASETETRVAGSAMTETAVATSALAVTETDAADA